MTRMGERAGDRDPFETHADRAGPLLLVFSKTALGEPPEHAELFGQIVDRRPRPGSLVVLQDRERSGFYRGAAWFGTTIDEVRTALDALIAELEPSEVITCGQGIGGHAALVFGVLLGASRIVAIEPPAHLIADELALFHDGRWTAELAELPDPALARRFDVSALIAETGFRGRAFVLLGTRRGNDHHDAVHQNVIHAHRLARSDRVTLCPFPEVEHDVLDWLAHRGDAGDVLSRYLFEPEDASVTPPRLAPLDADRLQKITTKRYQKFRYQVCRTSPGPNENGTASAVTYAAAGTFDTEPTRATTGVDDGWRQWIAGNLMLGASAVGLEEILVDHGISEEEAAREVRKALESPYLWGAQRLQNRLKKHDWLLATYRKLRRLHSKAHEVDRRYRLSRDEFLERYHSANRPVVITGMIDEWPALSRWSLDFFAQTFGDRDVATKVRRGDDPALEPERPDQVLTMLALVERLRQAESGATEDYLTLSAGEGGSNPTVWREIRDDAGPIPGYLDVEADRHGGTFRLASAGSTTPFELNLDGLLVAQAVGGTWFKVAPSWDLPLLRPTRDVFSDLDGRVIPASPEAPFDQPQILECLLEPGEILAVPVGWWAFTEAAGTSATLSFRRFGVANDFASAYPATLQG